MKTLIAIPCMDTMPVAFVRSILMLHFTGEIEVSFAQGSLIYDARNKLADKAIDGGFDRVLWLDSDMTFGPDLFDRLSARLDEGRGMVAGIYYTRKLPTLPVLYQELVLTGEPPDQIPEAITCQEILPELFRIEGCGFGAVMMDTSYLAEVRSKYGLPFYPIFGFGEDIAFCYKAKTLGLPIYADGTIQCGHVGQKEFTQDDYNRR